MRRKSRFGATLLAVAMLATGCYGPFTLTKKLHSWNGQVSDNKWAIEGVFLVTAVLLPVYGIATLADGIFFNSVEFWTRTNPLDSTK